MASSNYESTIPINNGSSTNNNNKKKQNYGSLRKDLPIQEQKQMVNLKHILKKGETLQGISLKYGVSVSFQSILRFK